jgi:Flp pilus assembly protein TadD
LALKDMDKAVELEPKNPYRYSSRAYINWHLKNMEQAVADYKMAIELDPDDAVAHNNLGMLEEQMGYQQQAQKRFKKADGLAVNKNGQLVNRTELPDADDMQSNITLPKETVQSPKQNFFDLLIATLTTRKGFLAYWKFLRGK